MRTIINENNIEQFAFTNISKIKGKPNRILLEFHGLNIGTLIKDVTKFFNICTQMNIVYLYPYDNPWSWMNDEARRFIDELLDAVYQKFDLVREETPIVACGGSMGGLSSLVYTCYSKYNIIKCAANCPICDLVAHSSEEASLLRTMYSSFLHYEEEFEDALRTSSPIHLVEKMPDIPYFIVHCGKDERVDIKRHSDLLVKKMKSRNLDVQYYIIPDYDHCHLTDEIFEKYKSFVLDI